MPNSFSVRLKLLSVGLLIVGMVSAVLAYSLKQSNNVNRRPARGFTLITKETATPTRAPEAGAVASGYRLTTRYQRSDGTWKQARVYYNDEGKAFREDIAFGIPGKGVFQLDQTRGTMNFISSMPPKEETSFIEITDEKKHANFLKDEVVQGFATHVLRFPDQDGGYVEIYRAPELNDLPIKRITVSNDGYSVEEAVEIKLGDPDARVFENLPNWFVRYERFEEKIQAMEDSGMPEAAKAMRQVLERELAKRAVNK